MAKNEINFRLIMIHVMKKWRKLLLAGVVCAVLFAGYKMMTGKSVMSDEAYEAAIADYEEKKSAYTTKQERLKSSLDELYEYANESVLIYINPYNEIETTATLYPVMAEDSTVRATQLAHRLMSYVTNGVNYDSISSACGLTPRAIRELVSVEVADEEDVFYAAEIRVIGREKEMNEKIMSLILEDVKKSDFSKEFGEYKLACSEMYTVSVVDEELTYTRTNTTIYNRKMEYLEENMASVQSELNTQNSLVNGLAMPVKVRNVSLKGAVRYGILGFFGGMILAIVLYAFIYIIKNPIMNEDEMQVYYKVNTLGILPEKCGKNIIDTTLARFTDHSYGISEDVAIAKTSVIISACTDEMKNILVAGINKHTGGIDALVEQLSKNNTSVCYTGSDGVNESAEELTKLKNSDGVILVVRRAVNTHDEVRRVLDTVKNSNVKVIGSIIV